MAYHILDQNDKRKREQFTVGTFGPDGMWLPIKDFGKMSDACWFIHYLNGGSAPFDLLSPGLSDRCIPQGEKR